MASTMSFCKYKLKIELEYGHVAIILVKLSINS